MCVSARPLNGAGARPSASAALRSHTGWAEPPVPRDTWCGFIDPFFTCSVLDVFTTPANFCRSGLLRPLGPQIIPKSPDLGGRSSTEACESLATVGSLAHLEICFVRCGIYLYNLCTVEGANLNMKNIEQYPSSQETSKITHSSLKKKFGHNEKPFQKRWCLRALENLTASPCYPA